MEFVDGKQVVSCIDHPRKHFNGVQKNDQDYIEAGKYEQGMLTSEF
ncbi:MAG TPA: hypothetical protein PKH94_02355 [Bacteroidales bacterium]|nr:hypothetical protein [Bacteroidales bacterium]HNS46059.1 hypothetical protein [Bacteroidales bacterium]